MNINENALSRSAADVAVIGGGTAGVFAAVSAARTGADTVLIEQRSRLGGTMTAGGVNYPGLFFAWGRQIIAGPCWEAVERTAALGGAVIPPISYRPERHWHEQILLDRFTFTWVLQDLCREAGVRVYTDTMLSAAEETPEGAALLLTDRDGLRRLHAKVLVDATGDAALARMLGYPLVKSPVQQPATLQNTITGYDASAITREAVADALAAHPDCAVSPDKLMAWFAEHRINNHTVCENADTAAGKAALERRALDDLMGRVRLMRTVPGAEHLRVDYLAQETGVRETNRIVGEDTVTRERYLSGAAGEDDVCYAFYPVDLHVADGIRQTFLADGIVPRVPYGALIPKASRRLLCAGRCVSADTDANSALRVEAPCMAMGQAAGCAAALAAQQNLPVRQVPYADLCRALTAIGAIVPEKNGKPGIAFRPHQ